MFLKRTPTLKLRLAYLSFLETLSHAEVFTIFWSVDTLSLSERPHMGVRSGLTFVFRVPGTVTVHNVVRMTIYCRRKTP